MLTRLYSSWLLLLFILPACVSGKDSPPLAEGEWYRPALGLSWQWQLSGELNTAYRVDVYDIDLFDTPPKLIREIQANGSKVICYFSAGSYEKWRADAKVFKKGVLGHPLADWPGERWLDIRSDQVLSIMKKRLDIAVEKGCDAVEPDNMDAYSNDSGFKLSAEDQLSFNRKLANEAHKRGLAIGLKNDVEQVSELVEYFDFAVNEQCFEYQECDALKPFVQAGKAVFNAEYQTRYQKSEKAQKDLCQQAKKLGLSTLVLPLELDDSFRISCLM